MKRLIDISEIMVNGKSTVTKGTVPVDTWRRYTHLLVKYFKEDPDAQAFADSFAVSITPKDFKKKHSYNTSFPYYVDFDPIITLWTWVASQEIGSLKGAPAFVRGGVTINDVSGIKNLQHMPVYVGGDVRITHCPDLVSLDHFSPYCARLVTIAGNDKLQTLRGLPDIINETLTIMDNDGLTDVLEHLPKKIEGDLIISNNSSLPKYKEGDLRKICNIRGEVGGTNIIVHSM